jgi:iron(II)-dependent oxidoreductase
MAATKASAPGGALLARLADARARTDALFDLVRPEALFDRPIAERHRIAFYVGHLEAFDWNLFRQAIPGLRPFHPEYDRLFAFGIDPVEGGLPADQPSDWPSIEEIRAYAARVRGELEPGLDSAGETLLHVAIEHRLMHAETLAYMLSQLDVSRKIAQPAAPAPPAMPVPGGMVEIPPGRVTLGNASGGFGWDNEFDPHEVDVAAFAIGRRKVTNGEYLEFIRAGGYETPALWTGSSWEWIRREGVKHPAFWNKSGGVWHWKSMFGEIPLPLDWPVWVSHAEASAYARWAGLRLPTEAEWQRAAYGDDRAYPWGGAPPAAACGNFDFARWDPAPVTAYPAGAGPFGLLDTLGNGWEWTSTVFEPFPGFRTFPFYPGYSANFFDGRHYVLKGGSPRTAACMLRRSFRNWFQPHYPYVYAGFRCVAE